MDINNLNALPEWKDRPDEDGESWKPKPTTRACRALYEKWNQILMMLTGALGTLKEISEAGEGESFTGDQKAMILGDAYEVGAKIRSSETGSMYILRMENAAIIRKNAQYIKTSVFGLLMEGELDEVHGEIIRAEIDVFRDLFKTWVSTFEKDEFADDWGLFI